MSVRPVDRCLGESLDSVQAVSGAYCRRVEVDTSEFWSVASVGRADCLEHFRFAVSSQMARASAPAVFPWKYHVFLSFRGEDTRRGFTNHLYKQLDARGIKTFRDEPELERGTDINPELLRAIDQSRSAIIVFSTNFASSGWCLREVTHIVRCMEEKERIFPIFYDVDPSDVRHQRGSFGEAFAEHEVNYPEQMEEGSEAIEGIALVLQQKGNLIELVDPSLGSHFEVEEAITMVKVALLCINPASALRPTMSAVVSMLEGRTLVHELKLSALRNPFDPTAQGSTSGTQNLVGSSDATCVNSATTSSDLYKIGPSSSTPTFFFFFFFWGRKVENSKLVFPAQDATRIGFSDTTTSSDLYKISPSSC
ncbi:hypothetical protein DVH24_007817 [Malus domestica]|uniref:ADP-ribosyl cyclase/cyclic ADP-ribose hydrolase n=1 Tax=Malus domestica TaxID=3750 RepID=A0A498JW97_MALDO|nr:hypothetical protein DVH24_007817 [Malus domestica]